MSREDFHAHAWLIAELQTDKLIIVVGLTKMRLYLGAQQILIGAAQVTDPVDKYVTVSPMTA